MLAELVELVLPRSCVGCGRDGTPLCRSCAGPDLQRVDATGLGICAATRYDAGVRAALIAYKERGRRDLAGPLGALLALAVGVLAPGTVLVPVPSSAAARRQRGGDHVQRLARVATRRSGAPVLAALALTRQVRDSAGLDAATRARNLDHAMVATRSPVPGRDAVIVDDITTTGTTLREAARALRAGGWRVDRAAVVAATPRRPTHPQQVPDIHTAATSGTPRRAGLT